MNLGADAGMGPTETTDMTSEHSFYGWKLVFILWLLDFLNMGFPLYGGAVINTYMLKEIPMSRSAFAWDLRS